ncbi:MAG: hypothetical protein QOJ40_320 [Verrucomicrobiota bacterium]
MKTLPFLVCAFGLCASVARSDASTLYGSTSAGGPGELWILDPATGAPIQDVGPLNDASSVNYAVTGLAFNPLDGVLYGSTGGRTGTKLLTINPLNGLVTVVGSYGVGTGNTMTDLAFDPSGNLFGIGSSGGPTLYSINIGTGQATAVGPSGLGFTVGGGLAISPGDVFYGTPQSPEFGTYDPTTGAYTHIANPTRPGGSGTSYASLAFDGNTLYGMDLAPTTHLVTIDPATGAVTDIGPSVSSIDGIAFLQTVPEPSTIALSLGAGAMALIAVRRQKQR